MHSEEARLYAKLPVFKRRIDEAVDIIEQGLSQCAAPYVACSFGKDSAVMLDLVRNFMPQIEARFIRWPESELLHNYDEVIEQWRQLGAVISILDLERANLDETVPERWRLLRADSDAVFNGMRKDESNARRATLNGHGLIFRHKNGLLRICPLGNWKTADVAAYCETRQLPTLTAYQQYGYEARTTARIPRAQFAIREQAIQRIRRESPERYAQLLQIYPEAEQWSG